MDVTELGDAQLDELRLTYLNQMEDVGHEWTALDGDGRQERFDLITDEMLYKEYEGVDFDNNDFYCSGRC